MPELKLDLKWSYFPHPHGRLPRSFFAAEVILLISGLAGKGEDKASKVVMPDWQKHGWHQVCNLLDMFILDY